MEERKDQKCKRCGSPFVPRMMTQEYCSGKCRELFNREKKGKKSQLIVCGICGREFEGYRKMRYCSKPCRTTAKRRLEAANAKKKYSEQKEKKQKKPTRTDKKKAEKRQIEFMRAAREAGMSYGKYRASGGVKPLEQEIFKGTIKTTDAWMGPAQCIYVGPDPRIKPKARIKRKAI